MPEVYVNAIYPPEPPDPMKGTRGRKNYKVLGNIQGADVNLLLNANKVDQIRVSEGGAYEMNISDDQHGNKWINSAQPVTFVEPPLSVGTTVGTTAKPAGSPPGLFQAKKDFDILFMNLLARAVELCGPSATTEDLGNKVQELKVLKELKVDEWLALEGFNGSTSAPEADDDVPF